MDGRVAVDGAGVSATPDPYFRCERVSALEILSKNLCIIGYYQEGRGHLSIAGTRTAGFFFPFFLYTQRFVMIQRYILIQRFIVIQPFILIQRYFLIQRFIQIQWFILIQHFVLFQRFFLIPAQYSRLQSSPPAQEEQKYGRKSSHTSPAEFC